ncbi:MAG: PepSY-associated TM helix domain-containing protein, partial [Ectothiorhodospiraceae bacterium]
MRIKRQLHLWHRYLGIALCLLIALWFASGVVMMYVPYPSLDDQRRLAGLPELESAAYLPPDRILADYPEAEGLRLNAASGKPAYVVATPEGQQLLDAITGEPRRPGRAAARETARRHSGSDVARASVRRVDQWTVTGNFDPHRPLRQMRVDDGAGTWVYVSSATGEVVQEVTRWQRGWNWVGAVVHWIYPWQLRQYPELWRNLVIVLCVPALALVVTGIAVGIQRLRPRRRYKGNRVTPYQGWQRWHHLLGVGCAVFLVTFLVSGLLSLNPAGVFDPEAAATEARRSWGSGPLVPGDPVGPAERINTHDDVRELVWQRRAGRSLVLIRTPDGTETRSA